MPVITPSTTDIATHPPPGQQEQASIDCPSVGEIISKPVKFTNVPYCGSLIESVNKTVAGMGLPR
jgi:C4-type Zn-finger protein